jgi:hypothetical protein
MRISVGVGKIDVRYRYLNIEAGCGDHLYGGARRGSATHAATGAPTRRKIVPTCIAVIDHREQKRHRDRWSGKQQALIRRWT